MAGSSLQFTGQTTPDQRRLKPEVGQGFERGDDEHQPPRIIKNVMNDQGLDGPNPKRFAFSFHIAERLAELRINLETGVDLPHRCCNHLPHINRIGSSQQPQRGAHAFRVDHPIACRLVARRDSWAFHLLIEHRE